MPAGPPSPPPARESPLARRCCARRPQAFTQTDLSGARRSWSRAVGPACGPRVPRLRARRSASLASVLALLPLIPTAGTAGEPASPLAPPAPPAALDPAWRGDAPACARARRFVDSRADAHRDEDPRYDTNDLVHIDLSLDLDPDSRIIRGQAVHHFMALRGGCRELLLDLVDSLRVTSVRRGGREVRFEHQDRLLLVPLDPPLAHGETASVAVEYEGRPPRDGHQGLAFDLQGDPAQGFPLRPVISTLSETHSAAAWWPCKNVTRDKFTIRERYTVPEPLVAVGNGSFVESVPTGDGRRTWHWLESYPIETYLVSVNAADYVTWSDTYLGSDPEVAVPIVYYAYPKSVEKARAAWSRTPKMMAAFAARFGEYPFPREKYATAEFNWPGGMENQTCTGYGTYLLEFDQASNERVVAHELAHSWWGNLVSPATWDDIWLNEGLAVYGEALWMESLGGRRAYLAHMQDVYRDTFEGPLVPPLHRFSVTVYLKGAWVVHMLRGVLGEERFFRALIEHRRNYAHGTASTEGFRASLEQYSGLDLGPFFDSWVYGVGRPFYLAVWTWESAGADSGRVELTLRQEQPEPVFPMPVPLVFHFAGGETDTVVVANDTREQRWSLPFAREPAEMEIDPEGWILKKVIYVRGPSGVEEDASGRPPEGARRWTLRVVPNPAPGTARILLGRSGDRRAAGADGASGTHPSPGPFVDGPGRSPHGPFRVQVCDALGRAVRTLPVRDAGTEVSGAIWDGRLESGARAPAGSYWVIAPEADDAPAVRFVLVR